MTMPVSTTQTDVGKEFTYLVKYDIATGGREVVNESAWGVLDCILSENEKYRMLIINEDARIKLKITDQSTGLEVVWPEVPGSNIEDLDISESEKYLLLGLGTSRTPGDLYLFEFGGTELKKLTNNLNPEINPEDLAEAEVVRYTSFLTAWRYRQFTINRSQQQRRIRFLPW